MAASPERIASGAGGPDDEAVRADAAALFERHRTVVEGVCCRLLRDPGEAQDAAQQTYLSAYQALLAGSRPRDGEAWLATIARHESLRRIRLRMREPLERAAEPADRSADVPEQAAANLAATLLWQEIGRLPPQQRDAVVLREFGGRSYVQIAAELGVSPPAVESLLFRARGRLRRRLHAALAALNLAPLATASAGVLVARLFGSEVAPRLASPLLVKGAAITAGLAMLGGGAVGTERHLDRPRSGAALPHAAPVSPRPRPAVAAVAPAPTRVVHRVVKRGRPAPPPLHARVVVAAPVSVPEPTPRSAPTLHAAPVAPVAVPAPKRPAQPPRKPKAPARSVPAAVVPPAPSAVVDDGGSHVETPEAEHGQPSSGGGGSHEGEGSGRADSGSGGRGSSGSGSSVHGGHGNGSASSGEGGSQPSGGEGSGGDDGTESATLDVTSGEGSDDATAEPSGPDEPGGDGGESPGEGSGGSGSGDGGGGHDGDSSGHDGGHSGPGGG